MQLHLITPQDVREPKTIYLTNGGETLVDAWNYDELNQWHWQHTRTHYVSGTVNKRKTLMHRLIMGALPGQQVDHVDGNRMNNQEHNLRLCTASQNHANTTKRGGKSTSQYKGIHWNGRISRWRVEIAYHGKRYRLNSYADEIDAACAYNEKAKELFGEFARLNDIPDDVRDASSIRRQIMGRKTNPTKLTPALVREIRRLLRERVGHSVIALQFHVSRSTISMISSGRIWSHVE